MFAVGHTTGTPGEVGSKLAKRIQPRITNSKNLAQKSTRQPFFCEDTCSFLREVFNQNVTFLSVAVSLGSLV